MDYPNWEGSRVTESAMVVRDALARHLSPDECERSAAEWVAIQVGSQSRDALFNSIVEFTRQLAKAHDLDTLAKQQIRSQLFSQLMPRNVPN